MDRLDQAALIAEIARLFDNDDRIRALLLSGSYGRGTEDAWSDIDLLAVVAREEQEAVATDWRRRLNSITPIVHWNRLPWAFVLNAVSEDWLRVDLSIVAPGETRGLTQDRLKPLFDRDGLYAALPARSPEPKADPQKLLGIVTEFIRILGLTHVADGRREYELAATGAGMLRGLLTNLLVEEMQAGDQGGMLHLSKKIDAKRMQLLLDLPVAEPNRTSMLTVNAALARAFFPRAKAFAAQIGMDWPEAFEDATRQTLQASVPDGDWGW